MKVFNMNFIKYSKIYTYLNLPVILSGVLLISCGTTDESPVKKEIVKSSLSEYYEGRAFEQQRQLKYAESSYWESIEISPRPAAFYRLAEVQRAMGQIAEAKYSVNKALELVPDYNQARLLKTVLDNEYPNIDPKKPEIAQLSPQTPDIAVNPTQQQQAQEVEQEPSEDVTLELQEQRAQQREAPQRPPQITLQPSDQALFEEANKLAQTQNWQAAASRYQNLIEKYPSAPQVHYKYGYALFHLERYQEAEQEFRRVLQIAENHAEAYNDLGVTLEIQGQITEAEQAYQRAIQIGQHPDAYYNLAVLNEKKGDYKMAINLYQEYLRFDSTSQYATQAMERIEKLRRYAF